MESIGQRVRAARTTASLSQLELARRAGIAQAAISRIERDETRDPGVLIVAAIALVLGLSLEDLVAGHVSPPMTKRRLLEERVARLEALLGVALDTNDA